MPHRPIPRIPMRCRPAPPCTPWAPSTSGLPQFIHTVLIFYFLGPSPLPILPPGGTSTPLGQPQPVPTPAQGGLRTTHHTPACTPSMPISMLRGHRSGLTFWTTEAAEGLLSSRATHWDLAQAPPSPGRLAQVPGGCLPTLPVSQGLVPLRGQSKVTNSPAHSSPGAQGLPGSINVSVEVLL